MSTKSDPAREAVAVTPSDSADIAQTRGLYVGADGDLSVIMAGGTTITFTAVPGGTIMPLCVSRVRATGTTATGIVALY